MYKRYVVFVVFIASLCAIISVRTCDTVTTPDLAIAKLSQSVEVNPLTDNDKNMIKTIVSARLKGMMLKINPNFSENGSNVYFQVVTLSECFGGFETPAGIAYGEQVLQLMQ